MIINHITKNIEVDKLTEVRQTFFCTKDCTRERNTSPLLPYTG